MNDTMLAPQDIALFDANDFDRLMAGDPVRARPTDPLTSHLAAAGLTEKDLHDSQSFVLSILIGLGRVPAWRVERMAFSEWSGSRIRTALVELEVKKLIRRYDGTGLNPRGNLRVDEFEAVKR